MNIPCDQSIRCDLTVQGLYGDSPIANFSSERPDAEIFVGYGPGWDENVPPLGTIWDTPGCISWCISNISQADADLCAAAQQILCVTNNPPTVPPGQDGSSDPDPPYVPPQGPGTDVPPGQPPVTPPINPPHDGPDNPTPVFPNTPQTCTFTCPDGTPFTETVEFGKVYARSQDLADRMAYSIACNQLQTKVVCPISFSGFACADPFLEGDTEYSFQFVAIAPNPPITWTLVSGSLPPQLTLESTGLLHGFPDTAGDYNFTVRATNASGVFTDKNCDFHVLGLDITTKDLPVAHADQAYSHVLPGAGGAIEYFLTDGALPNGLTLDIGGVISGTPDTVENSSFIVTVRDAFFNECSQDLRLEVKGPKITCPPTATVCTAYNQFVTAVPAGCTFSGTPPGGLTMAADGHITGTPKTPGDLVVTATDPVTGDVNTRTCAGFVVADPTPGVYPAAAKDLTWVFSHYSAGGTGSMSGTGDSIAITASGLLPWDGVCQIEVSNNRSTSHLRNCGALYVLTFTLNWTLFDSPCPANPLIHPTATIRIQEDGVDVLTIPVVGFAPGNQVYLMNIPNTPDKMLALDVSYHGPSSGHIDVSLALTPATPP